MKCACSPGCDEVGKPPSLLRRASFSEHTVHLERTGQRDRHQRVSQLWQWLPGFRAVAEVQHVRRAAERLHVSPSALSRTIHLLEEQLGHRLFRREGRSLRLEPHGELLLQVVRHCMRQIDDTVKQAARAIANLVVASKHRRNGLSSRSTQPLVCALPIGSGQVVRARTSDDRT